MVESDARDRYLARLDRRINDHLRNAAHAADAARVGLAEHDTKETDHGA